MESKTIWTIYCHVHVESGRIYVGLTRQTVERRWASHLSKARSTKGGRWYFPNAIRKYGKDAFSHHVLGICHDVDQANLVEECWIFLLDTRNLEKGFNLAEGGLHVPHPIRKNPWDDPTYRAKQLERFNSPEWAARMNDPVTKAKMSVASSSRTYSDEVRSKVAEAGRDREVSDKTRQKISTGLTGRKLSPEHIANSSRAQTGKKLSPEHVAKVAAANTGKAHSQESREAISRALAGRKLSLEHVKKIKNRSPNPDAVTKMLNTRTSFIPKELCKNGHRREGLSKVGKVFCKVCRYASRKAGMSKPGIRERLAAYKHSWHLKVKKARVQ